MGPQAQVSRSAQSGTSSRRRAMSSRPSVAVCTSVSRSFPPATRSCSSSRKITSCGRGALWTMTTSSHSASRSMPITGVMPL